MKQLQILPLLLFLCAALAAAASAAPPDYANHPLYSQYQFGSGEEKVVDLGTQPLAVPIGVAGAVLLRDRRLQAALQEQGWSLRSHSFFKGLDSNFFFARGDLEVVLAGDWPTITLAATQELQVMGLAKQGFSSLVAKGSRQVAELKGKRIGSAAGSTAHYGLLVALANAEIKETEVTIVPLEVNEMSEALAAGRIDAFASWEPATANALRTHPEFSVVQRFMNNSYIYFAGSWARNHPEIADLITAAYVRSLRWMRDDRRNLARAVAWTLEDGARLLGKPTALKPEEVARITTEDLLRLAAIPTVPRQDLAANGSIRRAFAFLQEQGKISASVPWRKIEESFDHSRLERILADPEKFSLLAFDYEP